MTTSILLALFATCLTLADCSDQRIVGGVDADENAFPYQVSVRKKGRHFCGGSIIEDRWVLTAAHCVSGQKAKEFSIMAGTNQLDSDGDIYKVEKFLPHPDYDSHKIINDIALIKVENPFSYRTGVSKIGLSEKGEVPDGKEVVLSGWGATSFPGDTPNNLQAIGLTFISREKCVKEHGEAVVSVRNVCTLNKVGEGACHGDSGGPLVYKDKQVGVVSWGVPCAKGKPDVYTKVAYYSDWIKENAK